MIPLSETISSDSLTKSLLTCLSSMVSIVFITVNFFTVVGLIVVRGGLGLGMFLFGRKRDAYRTHKRMAKYVLAVFLLQGALGLATLYGILPFVFGP